MRFTELIGRLECCPIIAAVRQNKWESALRSPASVIFDLEASLLTVKTHAEQAHTADKALFVHVDLAEGIGKDKVGIRYLEEIGVDGIISTRGQIIRMAKEQGLLTVQRFFAVDSQGMDSIQEMLRSTNPHLLEIMPGVIGKAIKRFSAGTIPVIAGGLIETKQEVTAALGNGTTAISTGCEEIWDL